MRFADTSILYWLPVALGMMLFIAWWLRRAYARIGQVLGKKMAPFLTSSLSLSKRRTKLILQTFCLIFLILAWARPQMGQSVQEVKSQGVEIIFAVDVSQSMLAEDVRPNRLEFAKKELQRLVDLLPGHKFGIVAFAGSAALISPISTDPSAIKMFIEGLNVESVSAQGTNFLAALQESMDAFKRGGVQKDEVNKVTRVILITSDGEDQEPGALAEAEKIVTEEGVRIFSVAVGTEKGAPIPQRDGAGYLRGYKKDRAGQVIMSATTGDALQALANKGKGSFYHGTFGSNYLQSLTEDIGKLEKAEFESSMAVQYDERYQVFLAIAVLLGLLELLLGERRKEFRLWRGRFEVPSA